MKKIYILAAIALVAGVSCTKQVPADNNSPDVAISFSPISQRAGTKANVYGEQNATYTAGAPGAYESFAAWAYYTAAASGTTNPQTNADATKGASFFGTDGAGVECKHHDGASAGTDYWSPDTPYFWPKTGYLHFHAMSPADFGTGTLAHAWGSGISITGYVAPVYTDAPAVDPTADASQIDLMYSDFEFDKQRADYSAASNVGMYDDEDDSGLYKHDGVNLLFRHALSLVQFKVKTHADYYSAPTHKHRFFVRKIEVLNAYNTGNFTENRANNCSNGYNTVADMTGKIGLAPDNSGASGTPYWTSFSNEVTLTPYDVTAGVAKTGTEAISTLSGQVGTTLIALPQALLHAPNHVQVRVTFDYQFSVDGGTNWVDDLNKTITVDLSGANGTYNGGTPGDYTVNNWLINHKYVYTLVFKLDEIIFDPAVSAFVTVDDIGVDLPVQN